MSFTPYNAPLLSGLLGDTEIATQFSIKSDLQAMLSFEVALASAQADVGLIPQAHAEEIKKAAVEFEPDMPALQQGVNRDGMAVPEFIRQFRGHCGIQAGGSLHFGSTSQDVIDTSLAIRLVAVNRILKDRLESVLHALDELGSKFGNRNLMARTRMQAALPVPVAHRLLQWRAPVNHHLECMQAIEKRIQVVQLGGPVGDLNKMDGKGAEIRRRLAQFLELGDPEEVWHTDRSRLADYCNWLAGLSGALGKIGMDTALMAQNELNELAFEGAGTSSAMTHKQNPVKAEVLVSASRFAAALNTGMQHNAVHEQERSGVAWTLEWLVIPQLCVVAGASLRNCNDLLSSITSMGVENI